MTDDQKTVFISYRRSASKHLARAIFMDLRANGYDVFLDVNTIDSGEFDRIILNQIAARAHFVVILSPGALERCAKEGDWLGQEIEEAMRLKRNIVPVIEEGFDFDHETGYLPESWREQFKRYNGPRLFHDYFDASMETVRTRFLKPPKYEILITPPPPSELPEIIRRIEKAAQSFLEQASMDSMPLARDVDSWSLNDDVPFKLPSLREAEDFPLRLPLNANDILPPPFEWITIPSGKVTLEAAWTLLKSRQTFTVPEFAIAKYPMTNAQFQMFVDATDGYRVKQWWDYSPEAAKWRSQHPVPNKSTFKGDDLPRTDITFYESVAFCRWLSYQTGTKIMLPTEQQWQRAAQGDTGWTYPWGDKFDKNRCNFNNKGTTPVAQYPNGASPYGVMDMSGNVWEWCLVQYNANSDNLTGRNWRGLRGGSWNFANGARLRVSSRYVELPDLRTNRWGFRLARSL